MGVFLHAAVVKNGKLENIKTGIQKVAEKFPDMNIISEKCEFENNDNGVLVIFNESANGYETLAKALSEEICVPVMLLYIYDSDGWGYFYCENGALKDLFSVCPEDASFIENEFDSQQQNTDMVSNQYRDSVKFIADRFNINANEIINYYRIWTDELIEEEEAAYEDDEFTYGDCWQMADFMRKLGFLFPDGGETEENMKTAGIEEEPELSEIKSPQAVIGDLKKYPETKKFFEYETSTPYAGAFDYEYRIILMRQYGSRLKDIIKMMESGEYRQARDELTKRIDSMKNNCNGDDDRKFLSGMYILRGSCSRTVGNNWQAGKDLDAAYELEPENVYILRQRIQAGTSKERIKREINDLNTLMRIDGKNYDYYLVERAWRYYRLEELEAARRDLMEAKIRCNSNDNMDFVALSGRLGV